MKEKKEGEIYSYTLRFNKELALDRQALEKIAQFCRMTDMTRRDAILLIIATADISALHNSILSLNVVPKNQEEGQEKRAEEKEHNKAEKKDREAPFREALPEGRYIRENQKKEQLESSREDNEDNVDLDSMIADIFNNF